MIETESTLFPRSMLKSISAADTIKFANVINGFTKELRSEVPLKLAAREMEK